MIFTLLTAMGIDDRVQVTWSLPHVARDTVSFSVALLLLYNGAGAVLPSWWQ